MIFSLVTFGKLLNFVQASSSSLKVNKLENRQIEMYASTMERNVKFCENREGNFEDPLDCTRSIRCVAGVPSISVCPAGQVFVPGMGCQPSAWPNCKLRTFYCTGKCFTNIFGKSENYHFDPTNVDPLNPEGVQTDDNGDDQFNENSSRDTYALFLQANLVPSTTFTCPADKGSFPIRDTTTQCQQFNICIKGQAYLGTCYGTLNFDVVTQKCLPAGLAHCIAPTVPNCGNGDGIYQQAGFCDRYIVCCYSNAITYFCKPGETFDIDSYKCVPTYKANCTP